MMTRTELIEKLEVINRELEELEKAIVEKTKSEELSICNQLSDQEKNIEQRINYLELAYINEQNNLYRGTGKRPHLVLAR